MPEDSNFKKNDIIKNFDISIYEKATEQTTAEKIQDGSES